MRNWLLLEQPGPWGAHAVRQSRLPKTVADGLRDWAEALGIRVILIRRPGRHAGHGTNCFLAHTGRRRTWMEHALLDDAADLLDADLRPLRRGGPIGLGSPHPGPIYLVCTNGRRDPCCAERGRPLGRALARTLGDRVWECSHIGGDRFAGNLVCFPQGIYFGRVGPEEGPRIAEAFEDGRLELDHYRGRCCYGFPVQAAEYFLRREMGLDGVGDVRPAGRTVVAGDEVGARFRVPDGRTYLVRLRILTRQEPRPLTCHAAEGSRPPAYELIGVVPEAEGRSGPG